METINGKIAMVELSGHEFVIGGWSAPTNSFSSIAFASRDGAGREPISGIKAISVVASGFLTHGTAAAFPSTITGRFKIAPHLQPIFEAAVKRFVRGHARKAKMRRLNRCPKMHKVRMQWPDITLESVGPIQSTWPAS